MDEPSLLSAAQISTGRRRLKTIIWTVSGILVVLFLGAEGYLVYNFIKENSTSSGEQAKIIQTTSYHQASTKLSQPPKLTSTSSTITVTSKQLSTLSASTDILSTPSVPTTISPVTETLMTPSHQALSSLPQPPRITPTSSTITVATKQPSKLLASANLLSTSSPSTTILSSMDSTELISSSMAVVTTERSSQFKTSCESESPTNLTGISPLDCSGVESCSSGVFYIFPYGEGNASVPVYCECRGEEGMWTVIQKRLDGSVDLNRNWTDYKNGFGDACGEYWLGNEALHQLSTNKNFKLVITMTGWNGLTKYALYDTFNLADEASGYRLNLGAYYGNADNSMLIHNGYPFSTGDRDNDVNANMNHAVRYSGPWWYSDALQSNLNGLYYISPTILITPASSGIPLLVMILLKKQQ